jgi:hypothetical protein
MKRPSRDGAALRWVMPAAAAVVLGFLAWNRLQIEPRTEAVSARATDFPTVATTIPPAPVAALPAPVASQKPGSSRRAAKAPARIQPTPAMTAAPVPALSPANAGMIVGIDPETGQPGMATAEQMRELFPLGVSSMPMNQSDEGLPIIHGPKGAIGVDLMGRFQEYYVVRIGPDGKQIVECSADPAVVMKAVGPDQPKPVPAGLEEK